MHVSNSWTNQCLSHDEGVSFVDKYTSVRIYKVALQPSLGCHSHVMANVIHSYEFIGSSQFNILCELIGCARNWLSTPFYLFILE